MKKVTKKLAKEIATKFFGRNVQLVEGIDEQQQRGFYGEGYLFESGAVQLNVFPYYEGSGKDFNYPNKYPFAQIIIDHSVTHSAKYIDGQFETENGLANDYDELRNEFFTLKGYLEDAINESKIDANSDFLDRYIVKDKSKLLKAFKILKDAEKLL